MPLSPSQVWEARTTGSDLNGGGFKAGASGTDYSQQDAAQVVYSDLAVGATSTQVTSAANPFSAAHVGNVLNITSGAGFTAGRYEVLSVASGVATLDRSAGTAGSAGGAARLGGAVVVSTLPGAMVAGNKAWVKSGTHSVASTLSFAQSVNPPTPAAPPSQLLGYAATRGDITESSANQAQRPLIRADAALGSYLLIFSGHGWHVRNLVLAAGSGSFLFGAGVSQNFSLAHNLKVSGHGLIGINIGGYGSLAEHCEVANSANATGVQVANSSHVARCCVYGGSGASIGINNTGQGDVFGCLVRDVAGASSDGIALGIQGRALFNTVSACGRHGVNLTAPSWANRVRGNVLALCGGYGLANTAGAGVAALPELDGNAYWANASGARLNLDGTGGANPANGSSPYANAYDLLLSANPFSDSAGGDYRLNNAAGGGAPCRGASPMNRLPGHPGVGYRDMGALQHQESAITSITFLEG